MTGEIIMNINEITQKRAIYEAYQAYRNNIAVPDDTEDITPLGFVVNINDNPTIIER